MVRRPSIINLAPPLSRPWNQGRSSRPTSHTTQQKPGSIYLPIIDSRQSSNVRLQWLDDVHRGFYVMALDKAAHGNQALCHAASPAT